MIGRLTADFTDAVKNAQKFAEGLKDPEKAIAKLQASLERLSVTSSKLGLKVADLDQVKQAASQLRQVLDTDQKLTQEQNLQVLAMQRYADIQRQDIAAQQVKINFVESQRKAQEAEALAKQKAFEKQQAADAKLTENAAIRIPQIQAESVLLAKKLADAGLESSELSKQTNILKEQIALLEQKRASGQQLTVEEAKRTQDLQKELQILQSQATTVIAQQPKKGGETFWERRFGWFVAGSVFYGTLQAAREIAENAKQIEAAMTTIRRVSNEPLADFTQMQQDLLNLGVQFGQTWNVVSDIAVKWAQAGYNVKDTVELTKTSLLALNTAELNSTQATQGLIAIMAQWGLQATELLPVLDKINRTADSYAISSADLIDGLSRSSGAAKMLGMSLEESIALLTVLRESSGRTGREVGNALNSMLAFIQRPGAIKAMQGVGIDVWADSTHTKLRNVMDIFSDIASRWPSMNRTLQDSFATAAEQAGLYSQEIADVVTKTDEFTQAQQREIATADAGTYRRNYFMALMANFGKVMGVLTNMENSFGYSMSENEKSMDTYAKKVYQLQAAWQSFSQVLAQAGLLDQLKAAADIGTGLLGFFNGLPRPVKAATGAIVEYAAALTVLRLAQKTFGLGSFTDWLKGLGGAKEAGFLASSQSWLGKAGSWLANIPVWQVALGAAGLATIISLIKQQNAYNKALEAGAKYYEDATRSGQDMATVLNTIGKQLPDLVLEFDKEGNVVKIATDQLERHAQALQNLQPDVAKAKQDLERLTAEFNNLQKTSPPSWWAGFASQFAGGLAVPGGFEFAKGIIAGQDRAAIEANREIVQKDYEARIRAAQEYAQARKGAAGSWTGIEPADLDAAKSRYDRATESALNLDLALIEVRKSLRLVESEEKSLGETMDDANRKKQLAADKARLLAEENDLLAATNGDLSDRLSVLNDLMSQANTAISILGEGKEKDDWLSFHKSLSSEIRSTSQALADNTVQMRENQLEIQNSSREVKEFYDKIREAQTKILDDYGNSMQHLIKMNSANRDQQIAQLREMLFVYADNAEKRREIEADLQDLYKQGIEEQMDLAEKAYRDRVKQIEDETDTKVKALQKEMDALDLQGEMADREQATAEHNKKLAELEKDLRYEQARLGKEHEKKIVEINKQIEDEKQKWQHDQADWSRENRKNALQQQIDDLKDAADKERAALEKQWEQTKEAFQRNITAIVSTAAVFQSSWYQTGLSWGQQLAEGFKTGSISAIQSVMTSINDQIGGAQSAAGLLARSRELLEAKRAWDRANELGDIAGMEAAAAWGNRIRASGPTLDQDMTKNTQQLEEAIRQYAPRAHTGALVTSSGLANLLKGEIVLNPQLSVQFARLADALERNPSVSTTTNFNLDKLVNVENMSASDKQDLDSLVALIWNRMTALKNSNGNLVMGVIP